MRIFPLLHFNGSSLYIIIQFPSGDNGSIYRKWATKEFGIWNNNPASNLENELTRFAFKCLQVGRDWCHIDRHENACTSPNIALVPAYLPNVPICSTCSSAYLDCATQIEGSIARNNPSIPPPHSPRPLALLPL